MIGASFGRLGEPLAGDSYGEECCSSNGRFDACAAFTAAHPAVGSMLCGRAELGGGGGGGKLAGGIVESAGRQPVRLEGGGRGSGGRNVAADGGCIPLEGSPAYGFG